MAQPIVFKIDSNTGCLEAIYNDRLVPLMAEGESTVRRASHVEPVTIQGQTWWEADMSPVGGPLLPARRTREEALAAEVAWLNANYLGAA